MEASYRKTILQMIRSFPTNLKFLLIIHQLLFLSFFPDPLFCVSDVCVFLYKVPQCVNNLNYI